jgi:Icc-related predicted phosphoesterase
MSDTHLMHLKYKIKMPEADMVIHSGDATFEGKLNEVGAFVEWFDKLPYKYKIFVAGNHDWIFQKNRNLGRSMLRKDMIYLEDDMVEVEGLKIYGSPWQPEFMGWAFNLPRGHRLREKWNKIPSGIDILVTHGPPLRILDRNLDGDHVGCGDLYEVVTKRVKPRLHTFGHIHLSYGMVAQGKTLFVNAAICGEDYKPNHGVVVVDVDPKNQNELPKIILGSKQEPLDPLGVPMFTNRPAEPLW